jgi:Protein of unknown function (DUF2380)
MRSIADANIAGSVLGNRCSSAIRPIGLLIVLANMAFALPSLGATSAPIKIAVFEFELEDVSAAGAASKVESASDLSRLKTVTGEARRMLKDSGRYSLVDTSGVSADAVKERTLRNCGGCDSGIALTLGADLSLIGVVTRVAQTEYYASVQITDTKTGKVVSQQNAFFTGADDAWASGVRLLLKHGILAEPTG